MELAMLVHSLFTSRLASCNMLSFWLLLENIQNLKEVRNAAVVY